MQEESTELMQVLTDCEPISSTAGASLKKEGEQLWTQLEWAPVRDDSGRSHLMNPQLGRNATGGHFLNFPS